MNDFKRLNELTKEQKSKLNAIYKNLDNELINEAVKNLWSYWHTEPKTSPC